MFKKILSFILICIISIPLVACGGNEEDTSEIEKVDEITLTKDEENKALENINLMCEDTAYDKADIKIKTELQEDYTKTSNVLKLIVIKDRTEVETYYSLNGAGDDIKDSIKKSLALDTAITSASEEINKINDFDKIVAVLYSSEQDYKDDNSYCTDILNIE
ncbi:hypothetical protein [Terrisporobacter vanillatitrophus]|uniref:hypothetical protein n=1 Tax=Terrisporobacter vanillatitrophus TaxID=3058402 RepID=UPI003367F3D2